MAEPSSPQSHEVENHYGKLRRAIERSFGLSVVYFGLVVLTATAVQNSWFEWNTAVQTSIFVYVLVLHFWATKPVQSVVHELSTTLNPDAAEQSYSRHCGVNAFLKDYAFAAVLTALLITSIYLLG